MASNRNNNSDKRSDRDTRDTVRQPNQGAQKEPLNVPNTIPGSEHTPTRNRNNLHKP